MGKQLLAEKIDSHEQMKQCLKLGFTLFQGHYFAKLTIIAGKKLDHSQLSLMRLMGPLLGDADTTEPEVALKSEPGLTLNLLCVTNSVGAGCSETITSLRHAITVLGLRQLQRWLQLLVFASGSQAGSNNPLLMLAAIRGRLMELLASQLRSGNAAFSDQAFMVGIMSLMPALVGQLVQVAEASEGGDPDLLGDRLAELPGLGPKALNRAQTEALQWANSIAKDKG
ncbi:EAL and HDOD domain-containing protein [Dechloromonas sp.]|uniref:EAL and HDOD domain-containing protein n=1 Tax=Dechloromonas sp. TaxID=1917218 RepID=UPI00263F7AED|nr:HDOD domain-containing protein [Dechloromonas sp.]